jgi:hypothetical protein
MMGFGSLATVFYTCDKITMQLLNQTHGNEEVTKKEIAFFERQLEKHQ